MAINYTDGKRDLWRHVCPSVPSLWAFRLYHDQNGDAYRPQVKKVALASGIHPGFQMDVYMPVRSVAACPWCRKRNTSPGLVRLEPLMVYDAATGTGFQSVPRSCPVTWGFIGACLLLGAIGGAVALLLSC